MRADGQGGGDAYDRVPYTAHAYAEAHPERLAVVARLSRREPPSLAAARVLEVGCGRGGNLLPMAESLPGATLVGVDLSRGQIEAARSVAAAASLANVTFHAASFEDALLAEEPFDFVICHGVASWITPPLRSALFARVASFLAPEGIAYVSFNTFPGWYERLAARDFMRHTGDLAKGDEARASLAWLVERVSPELATYKRSLASVLARLDETDRAYLVHEYLEAEHHPLHVGEFLDEASAAGLAYVGDAVPQSTALELLDDAARARAERLDVRGAETVVDFVKNTAFRRALLVHAREGATAHAAKTLDPRAIDALFIASRLTRASSEQGAHGQFDGPEGSVHVSDPVSRRALDVLAATAPGALSFDDLCARADARGADRDALRTEIFDLWLSTGAIDLHAFTPRLATTPSARPLASPLTRYHAAHGGPLTNAWHQEVVLREDIVRVVLGLLDGTRSPADIARAMTSAKSSALSAVSPSEIDAVVEASLALLARSALLVG